MRSFFKKQKYVVVSSLLAILVISIITLAHNPIPYSINWSNTSLITTDNVWSVSLALGMRGYSGADTPVVPGADARTTLTDSLIIDVDANETDPNTLVEGGVAEFEIANPTIALKGSDTAHAPYINLLMRSFGLNNVRVRANVRDIDSSVHNAVQQVVVQYRTRDDETGPYTDVPSAYIADATQGGTATLVTPIDVILPPDAEGRQALEIRIMTVNAVGNDEWVGIDDIMVTATVAPITVNSSGEGADAMLDGVCDIGGGICTLRAAIQEANLVSGANTINLGPGITTINVSGSLPDITTTMSILAPAQVTINGNGTGRLFNVLNGGNLTLSNLRVQNGMTFDGGGLLNQSSGTVSLTNCDFSGNSSQFTGGGIRNDGVMTITTSLVSNNTTGERGAGIFNGPTGNLTVTDSTVSLNGISTGAVNGGGGISSSGLLTVNRSTVFGNRTAGSGGGIHKLGGTANLNNSTVSFNSTSGNGGGIFNSGGTFNINSSTITGANTAVMGGGVFNEAGSTVNVRSTIIAENGPGTSPDVFGTFAATSAFNLIGALDGSTGFVNGVNSNIVGTVAIPVDPGLASIADNGGPTRTYALMAGSRAIDKGIAFGTTDQRGFARTVNDPAIAPAPGGGDNTDIGSFEQLGTTAALVSLGGRVLTASDRGIRNAAVTIEGGGLAEPKRSVTGSFGFYNFEGLEAGQTYFLTIRAKRYVFQTPSLAVNLDDNLANVDFVADPQ